MTSFQQKLQRTTRFFSNLTAAGASLSMAVLFLIVFINSIRRYTIGKSFEWGEELPIYVTIFGVMFGMALAYVRDQHIRFTMLVGFLSASWRKRLSIFVDVVMIANGVLLTYSGWLFVVKRGGMEASGIINLAKALRTLTEWEGILWIGHMYPYQFAMVMGGILLTLAASLKLALRLSKTSAPEAGKQ